MNLPNFGDIPPLVREPVGPGQRNRPRDVRKVRKLMHHLNALDGSDGQRDEYDAGLGTAIQRYQRRRELAPDQIFGPKTEARVRRELLDRIGTAVDRKGTPMTDDARRSRPGPARTRSGHFAPESQTRTAPDRGRDLLRRFRHPMTPDGYASTRRSIHAIVERGDPGDYHRWLVAALKDYGEDAISDVAENFRQLAVLDGGLARELFSRFKANADQIPEVLGRSTRQASAVRLGSGGPPVTRDQVKNALEADVEETIEGASEGGREAGEDAGRADGLSGKVAAGIAKHAPDFVLDGAERAYRAAADAARLLGLDDAAGNLERYLDAEGGDKTISRDEALALPPIKEAYEENRKLFATRTLVGKTNNLALNAKLKNLQDGQTEDISDHWDANLGLGEWIGAEPGLKDVREGIDNYLAHGRVSFTSEGEFKATRDGDTIIIEGTVTHGATDPYDFTPGDESSGGDSDTSGDSSYGAGFPLAVLDRSGHAKVFTERIQWQERVTATVVIGKDGELTVKDVTWRDGDK